MKKQKFEYQDLLDLGFVREDCHDEVHLNRYGYDYFVVYKTLIEKKLIAEWDDRTRHVRFILLGENEIIEEERVVRNEQELRFYISLFEK